MPKEPSERDRQNLEKARRKRVQTLLDSAADFDRQTEVAPGKKERAGHRRAAKLAAKYRAKADALTKRYDARGWGSR